MVVATALAGAQAAAPPALPELQLQAEFRHELSAGVYATRLGGLLVPEFRRLADGSVALAFTVGRSGCRAGAWWQGGSVPLPPPPGDASAPTTPLTLGGVGSGATRPTEICVAKADVAESELAAWLAGAGAQDPRLAVHLVPQGTASPASWVSAVEITAALFMRGCVGSDYRRLGTLRFAPGSLGLREVPDAQGVPRLTLDAQEVALETSGTAWAEVLSGCGGGAAGLPTTPAPGSSTLFVAAMRVPTPESGTLEAALAALFDAIDALVAERELPKAQAGVLSRTISRTGRRLRSGDSAAAKRALAHFDSQLTSFVRRGILAPASALELQAGGDAAAAAIDLLATAPPVPPPDPDRSCELAPAECPFDACALTTYHVDPNDAARLGCGLAPPGSPICAFETLSQALAQAAEDDRCGVELRAAAGLYVEDVELVRHVHIRGSGPGATAIRGTLSNGGPFELRLEGLTVAPADGRGVFVDDPCARTSLSDVVVVGAREYGVRQRGGSLDFRDGAVSLTRSTPASIQHGTGIYLSCGALASLDDVNLVGNESAGLALASPGTAANARDLFVSSTGVHPDVAADPLAAPARYGAVQVHDGARLVGALFSILDSRLAGLQLTGEGTSATLGFVGVSRTRSRIGNAVSGVNLQAVDGAILDLSHFTSNDAGLAGVQIAREGEADLHGLCLLERTDFDAEGRVIDWECLEPSSVVTRNPIGANVQTEGFDLGRIQDGVIYRANTRSLDATELPVPDAAGSIDD